MVGQENPWRRMHLVHANIGQLPEQSRQDAAESNVGVVGRSAAALLKYCPFLFDHDIYIGVVSSLWSLKSL